MASIYKEVVLAIEPDRLWAMVSDVGGISALLDIVDRSAVDGQTRSCTLSDGAVLKETILAVDAEHRRVAYTIDDSPFPLTFHAASMQVGDAGDGLSRLLWITDVSPDEMVLPLGELIDNELTKLQDRF